jgi:hypothetical protein
MRIKKVNELNDNKYINRDEPNTPFHSSDTQKNWNKDDRYVPPASTKPYLSDDSSIEDELREYNLTKTDLDSF